MGGALSRIGENFGLGATIIHERMAKEAQVFAVGFLVQCDKIMDHRINHIELAAHNLINHMDDVFEKHEIRIHRLILHPMYYGTCCTLYIIAAVHFRGFSAITMVGAGCVFGGKPILIQGRRMAVLRLKDSQEPLSDSGKYLALSYLEKEVNGSFIILAAQNDSDSIKSLLGSDMIMRPTLPWSADTRSVLISALHKATEVSVSVLEAQSNDVLRFFWENKDNLAIACYAPDT